jgi:hypothetical protein
MFSHWDAKHWAILAMFVAGFGWAIWAAVAALPAVTAASVLGALAPLVLLSVSHWMAFFKSPPTDPVQAFQQGEQAGGGASGSKAGQRGIARVGVLLTFAAIGVVVFAAQAMSGGPVVHPMAVEGQGCAWFQKNAPVVEQWGEQDVLCVFSAIMGGSASFSAVATTCAPLTVSQVAQISTSLFDFYALQQTDAGLAGTAAPPAVGLPASLTQDQFAKLRSFCGR